MRRVRLLMVVGFVLLVAGMMVMAQNPPGEGEGEREIAFVIESEIGRALPRSILYDPVYERMAVIDAYGRLLLVDALTYKTLYVLHERGQFNDLAFSHDGRWLALAMGTRIELWDTATGALAAELAEPGQTLQVIGPLAFSRDDNLLRFDSVHPAPRSIRQYENETITIPWLWNLTAARNEGLSTFPRKVEAWQFFDYRNGFVIGPDDRIVAALPGRLQVLDAYSLQLLFEIPTDRYERDPLTVWFSARDNKIYVRPVNENSLIQVDTQQGVLVEIPLGEWLTPADLELVGGIELSAQARLIGEPSSRQGSALLMTLLGSTYRRDYDFHPLTVTLIDLIIPPAATGENISTLLFVYDEQARQGRFLLNRTASLQQMVLNPDDSQLMIRQVIDNEEYVVRYDLNTGEELSRFIPALRAIGSYSRTRKNRVLAYDQSGAAIVSDFQRLNARTNAVLGEDLRYSRRFERFFFTDDSQHIVTLSRTEWRLWSVQTSEVVRREVLSLRGSIMATSNDGFRFLTRYDDNRGSGVEVVDLHNNTRQNVDFDTFQGRDIDRVLPDSAWQRFLVVYAQNAWGPYYPGNEIAMYDLDKGRLWFMAGDDLPPAEIRDYGWVDDSTVYVYGEGDRFGQPGRIYDLLYDPSGLPSCAVQAFPDELDLWVDLWERLVLRLRPDTLGLLTKLICADLPETAAQVQQLLLPTATPRPVTPTPIVVPGVPVCLTARYPRRVDEFAVIWREITAGLPQDQIDQTERLLCEGIGKIEHRDSGNGEYIAQTMMIDAATGTRATGAFTPREVISRPIYPIQDEFERTEERPLGQAILSPNEQLVAASSLPGELVVYRMVVSYTTLLDQITATADAYLRERNLISVLPSPTPTYNAIGTPRPTLTPTVTPTPVPRPQERVNQPQRGQTVDMCPAESLYSIQDPPEGYSPTGQLIAPVLGETLWSIEPEDGSRRANPSAPACGIRFNCTFSPDSRWILVTTTSEIYVIRPDGSDERQLFGEDDAKPPYIDWSGARTLEYEVRVRVTESGRDRFVPALQRDILGVFPDPEPWIPNVVINDIQAEIISLQPGGPLVLARTTFSTGVGPGYKYYLYNLDTGTYTYFARLADYPPESLTAFWHDLGDRLFYAYPKPDTNALTWYQIDTASGSNQLLGTLPGGTWSGDGRYIAYMTNRRAQPVAVWDSQTGLTRTYCLPQTGARLYYGQFTWSPDNRYLALQTALPEDEDQDVGQHTLILDLESGAVVDLTTGVGELVVWSQEPGTYSEGR